MHTLVNVHKESVSRRYMVCTWNFATDQINIFGMNSPRITEESCILFLSVLDLILQEGVGLRSLASRYARRNDGIGTSSYPTSEDVELIRGYFWKSAGT